MIKKAIFLYFFLISVANSSSLPLIGLDSKGNPKEVSLKKSEWDLKLKKSISILSESTLESLDKSKFSFYKVSVGTYIKMKLGIGSLITATAEPYFKLYFSKK
tara:strand:- start:305 stop:613 length:309 start_codon:yes stop_codon:yes gene_type:complete